MNQWANVVRWERRTRLFLRTSEFLWQEGHTAHETEAEAMEETRRMLEVYRSFAEDFLAIPVLAGEKTEAERFAGAVKTFCIEGMMQDGKALQMGTSHFLGQNFSRAFGIQFEGRDQRLEYAWTTSWGVSTRLIGALIMVHSDDEGLVLPPKVAPTLAVLIPIFHNEAERTRVLDFVGQALRFMLGDDEVAASERRFGNTKIQQLFYDKGTGQSVLVDRRDTLRPGEKHYYWEQRGVPLRIEVGPRDVEAGQVVVKSRVDGAKEVVPLARLNRNYIGARLMDLQKALFDRARAFRDANIRRCNDFREFSQFFAEGRGFLRCHFNPSPAVEAQIKELTKATVRLIPLDQTGEGGVDVFTGEPASTEVIFGIAY